MTRRTNVVLGLALSLVLAACGSNTVPIGDDAPNDGSATGDGAGGDGSGTGDGGITFADAPPSMCNPAPDPALPQCSNGCDDDGDGEVDGADIECTGAHDNDEAGFATGIHGDNIDAKQQDCFFDGNSGSGGGDCQYYTCCLLDDPQTPAVECGDPDLGLQHSGYEDPQHSCGNADECKMYCADLAPPGCDCFGCCTICDAAGCVDIAINPVISPDCNDTNIHDPTKCTACFKSTECNGGECDTNPNDCILCPGEDPSNLPMSCGGTATCPNRPDGSPGITCDATHPCGANQFCASGCCVASDPG